MQNIAVNVNFSEKIHKSQFVPVKFPTVGKLNEPTPATSEAPSEKDNAVSKQIASKFCVWHKSFIAACKTCQEANEEKDEVAQDSELKGADKAADKAKHRYFVSNYFVEKIFDNIMNEI